MTIFEHTLLLTAIGNMQHLSLYVLRRRAVPTAFDRLMLYRSLIVTPAPSGAVGSDRNPCEAEKRDMIDPDSAEFL